MSLCDRECSRCVMQMHCQGCSLCEIPFCNSECSRCFSLCPKRPAAFGHLKKIGGGELHLKENQIDDLPVFIPVVPDHLPIRMKVRDTIGVHGGKMMTSSGENVSRVFREKGIQEALNLENPVESVLQFYVKDRAIEGLWDNRKEVYKQLGGFTWRTIIAPNFSVYEDAPRVDHLYNMKRSNIVYNELLDAGFNAVPDISWYNRIDLDQWAREIIKNNIKTISYSFQTVSTKSKASNTWRHYMMGFDYLIRQIPEDVSIILAGIVSPEKLKVLRTAGTGLNRISILNQTAYLQSRRGVLSEEPGRPTGELSKEKLFERNMVFYETEYLEIGLGGNHCAKIKKQQHRNQEF